MRSRQEIKLVFKEETLSSEYRFKGRIVNLREDTVTVKNGTSKREIVEHHGGAACVAVTKDRKIILIRQFRKAFEDVILEIPAGKIEESDPDPLGTVKRELKEETGFTAGTWTHLSSIKPSVGYTTEIIHLYMATDLTPGETDFDENEAIDTVYMDFEEAFDMAVSGQITDAKTVCGILLAAERLRQEQ